MAYELGFMDESLDAGLITDELGIRPNMNAIYHKHNNHGANRSAVTAESRKIQVEALASKHRLSASAVTLRLPPSPAAAAALANRAFTIPSPVTDLRRYLA